MPVQKALVTILIFFLVETYIMIAFATRNDSLEACKLNLCSESVGCAITEDPAVCVQVGTHILCRWHW